MKLEMEKAHSATLVWALGMEKVQVLLAEERRQWAEQAAE